MITDRDIWETMKDGLSREAATQLLNDQEPDVTLAQEIAYQIGRMTIAAISGGRTVPLPNGLEMPAGNGYHVRITLDPSDTYTVERIYRKGGREFPHGTRHNIYCDDISNVAYRASSYRSYTKDEW